MSFRRNPRAVLLLVLPALPLPLLAQSTTQNSPGITTGWVAPRHEMVFDLVHRFALGPAPSRKVLNASTLGLYLGLTGAIQLGVTYASASEILPLSPNEFEFSARGRVLRQATGSPADLFLHAAYNKTIGSFDGQVNIGRRIGAGRVTVTGTWLGDAWDTGEGRGAIGGGLIIPVMKNMALAGDATTLLDRKSGEPTAWSVGLQMAIAETPHTLSLHVSNVAGRTLQGSVAGTHTTRVGFEYTIPITFGARRTAIAGSTPGNPAPSN